MSEVRGREIAMIFQNPRAALNPIRTVGRQIADVLIRHGNVPRREAPERAIERGNLEFRAPFGPRLGLVEDGVSVTRPIHDAQQDVELDASQREDTHCVTLAVLFA